MKGQNRTSLAISTLSHSRKEQDLETDLEMGGKEDQQMKAQLPTKTEMAAMFAALENSSKTEMITEHNDLGHTHTRVEETEKRSDIYTKIIKELKGETNVLKIERRLQEY